MTIVKTDYKGYGRPHRTHRGKKNRRKIHKGVEAHVKAFKQKKLAILTQELDNEVSNHRRQGIRRDGDEEVY